jgi:hypothetical protein
MSWPTVAPIWPSLRGDLGGYINSYNGFIGLQNSTVRFGITKTKPFLALNVMISQMVRSECVRFGEHVGIEVFYKIFQLEVLQESPNSNTSPCFQEGLI